MKNILICAFFLLFTNHTFAQLIPPYIPLAGLTLWWPFNGNANDESGNGNNGVSVGAQLTKDRFGNDSSAYYFSGLACNPRIEAVIDTTAIQTGLSISIWLMRYGNGCSASPRILEFWPGNSGPGSLLWKWNNNSSQAGMGSVTSSGFSCYASAYVPNDCTWVNLIYTNDGIRGKFYKDGALINNLPSQGFPVVGKKVGIGRLNHSASDAFNGVIDDIGIWNRALTLQEVHYVSNTCYSLASQPTDQIVTAGNNAYFTLNQPGTIAQFQWQQNLGTGFLNLFDFGPYHGTSSDSLVVTNVQSFQDNYAYRCIITQPNCIDTSNIVFLKINTIGILETESISAVTIYPNPSNGIIHLHAGKKPFRGRYIVSDLVGREIKKGLLDTETILNLSDLDNGVFLLKIDNKTFCVEILKD